MVFSRKVKLEKGKRFSESILWQYQMDYFSKEGVNAWVGQVPYYITSNLHIADTYALNILNYYRDLIRLGQHNTADPVYIIELGTGSGKFSFYLLKRLEALRDRYLPPEAKLLYIMSDFTESNIDFWQKQPQLQRYVEEGVLDFAQFNMISDDSIYLTESKRTLKKGDFSNGLMVLGNYIFDTVPHDAFHVRDNKLFDSKCYVETSKSNLDGNQPKDLSELNVVFKHQATKNPPEDYNAPLRKVMDYYVENVKQGSFLIPITGLRTLDNLNALAENKTMVLTSDKGYSSFSEIDGGPDPSVVFHGSFSMMVNFHAMALYNEYAGGQSYVPPCLPGIRSIAMINGFTLEEMPGLKASLDDTFGLFSPAQYFNLHRYMRRDPIEIGLEEAISYLSINKWDPYVFRLLIARLSKTISDVPSEQLEILDEGMKSIDANFYQMPNDEDVKFDIGYYFHIRQQYDKAQAYYQESIKLFGEKYSTFYNLGVCYFETSQFDDSVMAFQKALLLEPEQREAKKWLDRARMAGRV